MLWVAAMATHPLLPPGYARRRPERSVLHQVLREHLETFLERVGEDPGGPGLPRFVEAEEAAVRDRRGL